MSEISVIIPVFNCENRISKANKYLCDDIKESMSVWQEGCARFNAPNQMFNYYLV